MKVGKDERVREVNIAYKVIMDDEPGWRHNVGVRPVMQCIKLFEIKDMTHAEDMKEIKILAEQILKGKEEVVNKTDGQAPGDVPEVINIQDDDQIESDKTKVLQEVKEKRLLNAKGCLKWKN